MEILILGIYSIFNDQHIKNYLKTIGNSGLIKYEFVNPVQCKTGPRKKTYVLAPTGTIFLKQVSHDGKIGKIKQRNPSKDILLN